MNGKSDRTITITPVENGFHVIVNGTREMVEDGLHRGRYAFESIGGLTSFLDWHFKDKPVPPEAYNRFEAQGARIFCWARLLFDEPIEEKQCADKS